MIKEGDQVSAELDEFLATEYLAAVEIYKASNSLVRVSKANFWACIKVAQEGGLAPENCHRMALLSALAQCAANGTLDRELNAEEKAEKERRRNAEFERRDRSAGNAGTPRGHLDEHERERLELEAKKNLLSNLKTIQQRITAETTSPEAQEDATASDCLFALTQGDPNTPLTRERVQIWLAKWPAEMCRSVRRRQENIRDRMDEVLQTGVDPMIGVSND